MKPVSGEKLSEVLTRAAGRLEKGERVLFLKLGGEMLRLPLREVRYLEVRGNYVTVHAAQDYSLKSTLSNFEKSLDARFFRTGYNACRKCGAARKGYRLATRTALINMAGLSAMVERLPQGLDTYISREVFEDGVELSGGEAQKIALARALYKDAPFIILDKPTAALDPIAENKYIRNSRSWLAIRRRSIFPIVFLPAGFARQSRYLMKAGRSRAARMSSFSPQLGSIPSFGMRRRNTIRKRKNDDKKSPGLHLVPGDKFCPARAVRIAGNIEKSSRRELFSYPA